MELAIWVQILDKVDCVSFYANTRGKAINSYVLIPAMSKQ